MSDAPSKHLFFVYAPDLTDPDAFARRMTVRERHLVDAGNLVDKGFISALLWRPSNQNLNERQPYASCS
jgi:hypothetical protein